MFNWIRNVKQFIADGRRVKMEALRSDEALSRLADMGCRLFEEESLADVAKKAAYEAEWNELNARCGAVYPGHTCHTVGCVNSHLRDTFKELHKCICDLEAVNNGGLELAFPSHSVMPTRLDLAIRGRIETLVGYIERLNVEAEWHMARMAKEKNDA